MEQKLVFSPDKNFNSISNLRSRRSQLSPEKIPKSLKPDLLISFRKNLPQTSNLLLSKRKGAKKFSSHSPEKQKTTTKNQESENLGLLNKARDKLSKDLLKLISQICAAYGNCPIFPDASSSECSFYDYLFDPSYAKILSVEDLKSKPEFMIISTRPYLIEPVTNLRNIEKTSLQEAKSVNCINLYSSIINKDQPVESCKRLHKSPVYKLKTIEPRKYSKSPAPRHTESYELYDSEPSHIFPSSKGGRVKEGAGGFRKPFLFFDKSKQSSSPVPDKLPDFVPSQHSHSVYKDSPELDDMCLKHSLTQSELLTILSDFSYIKENHLNYIEYIKEIYFVKSEILLGINPNFASEAVHLEDFIKFYVVVVLGRGGFFDLLTFFVNFLGTHRNRQEEILWISRVFGKNYQLVEKVFRVRTAMRAAEKRGVGKGDMLGCVQAIGMNIFELRLIVTLIIKNF